VRNAGIVRLARRSKEYREQVHREVGDDVPVSACWDDVGIPPPPKATEFWGKTVIWTRTGTNPRWEYALSHWTN